LRPQLTEYNVHLKTTNVALPVTADKFDCGSDGYVVFYARPSPQEKFEEVARFLTKNIYKIKETPCPNQNHGSS
jgi:hypothetical protein